MRKSEVKAGAIIRPNEFNLDRVHSNNPSQWRIYEVGLGKIIAESLESQDEVLVLDSGVDIDYYELVPDDEIALRPGWFKGAPGYWSKYDGSEIYSLGDRMYAACTITPKRDLHYVQYYGCDIYSTNSLVSAQIYAEHYLHLNRYDLEALRK